MPSPLESSKKVKPLLQISSDSSIKITSFKEETVVLKDGKFNNVLVVPPRNDEI